MLVLACAFAVFHLSVSNMSCMSEATIFVRIVCVLGFIFDTIDFEGRGAVQIDFNQQ